MQDIMIEDMKHSEAMQFLDGCIQIKQLLDRDDQKIRKLWASEEIDGRVFVLLDDATLYDDATLRDRLHITEMADRKTIMDYIKDRLQKDKLETPQNENQEEAKEVVVDKDADGLEEEADMTGELEQE